MCPPHASPHHAKSFGETICTIASEVVEFSGSATRYVTPLAWVMEENVIPEVGS
jgi:hypothetical protein